MKVIINPLFAENAWIKINQGKLEELIEALGKWQEIGPFHLLFEKWNKLRHSRPLYTKGFGSWIAIKNLPLDYWNRNTFEATGAYFGGLESIAYEILNLLNCSDARVKRNLCGFMPLTIEIKDEFRVNIFLNFGDFEALDPLVLFMVSYLVFFFFLKGNYLFH